METMSQKDLEHLLKGIPQLNPKQREYVEGLFNHFAKYGHISPAEAEKVLRELKSNTSDGVNEYETGKIREALDQHFNPETEQPDENPERE